MQHNQERLFPSKLLQQLIYLEGFFHISFFLLPFCACLCLLIHRTGSERSFISLHTEITVFLLLAIKGRMKIEEPCLHPSVIHPEICLERVLKDEVSLVWSHTRFPAHSFKKKGEACNPSYPSFHPASCSARS